MYISKVSGNFNICKKQALSLALIAFVVPWNITFIYLVLFNLSEIYFTIRLRRQKQTFHTLKQRQTFEISISNKHVCAVNISQCTNLCKSNCISVVNSFLSSCCCPSRPIYLFFLLLLLITTIIERLLQSHNDSCSFWHSNFPALLSFPFARWQIED